MGVAGIVSSRSAGYGVSSAGDMLVSGAGDLTVCNGITLVDVNEIGEAFSFGNGSKSGSEIGYGSVIIIFFLYNCTTYL